MPMGLQNGKTNFKCFLDTGSSSSSQNFYGAFYKIVRPRAPYNLSGNKIKWMLSFNYFTRVVAYV